MNVSIIDHVWIFLYKIKTGRQGCQCTIPQVGPVFFKLLDFILVHISLKLTFNSFIFIIDDFSDFVWFVIDTSEVDRNKIFFVITIKQSFLLLFNHWIKWWQSTRNSAEKSRSTSTCSATEQDSFFSIVILTLTHFQILLKLGDVLFLYSLWKVLTCQILILILSIQDAMCDTWEFTW